MKLTAMNSVELKAIGVPEKIKTPPFVDNSKIENRIFGALCRINPELPCMEDEKFLKNVFKCIKAVNPESIYLQHGNLSNVEFMKKSAEVQKWRNWYTEEKEKKAAERKEHKDEIKEANEAKKAKYGFAVVNGVAEPLQSWLIEPEGIYFGRGDCPYNGFWKRAPEATDVVVNTNSSHLPVLIEGEEEKSFKWNVKWEPESHYGAVYPVVVGIPSKDGNIKEVKYTVQKKIMFSAQSSVKKEGQEKKYAAGAVLGRAYNDILKKVTSDFKSNKKMDTAIAVFCLFEKGIRIGNKKATANGTKGLLSLQWGKDVKRKGNKIKFDFYGKDSVHDVSEIETPFAEVIEKTWSASIQLDTSKEEIEAYVSAITPEIADVFSPKLARTAVAAATMLNALEEAEKKFKVTKDSSIVLKKMAFDEAAMAVAKRLNHQRGVNKIAEQKRKAKFEETEQKLVERAEKVKAQIKARKEKIKTLKDKEKIKKLRELNEKAEERLALARLNLTQKESGANHTSSTAKGAYIDPSISAEWASKIGLPLEKIYSKSQMKQFEELFKGGNR